jgi:predicted Zn-dependent protease
MDESNPNYYNVFQALQRSFHNFFMIYQKPSTKIFFVACAALLISSCVRPTSNYPQLDKAEVEAERKLQQEAADAEKARKEKEHAAKMERYGERLKEVGMKIQAGGLTLCSQMKFPKNNCLFDFYITQERGLNAFADGKKIHITQSMMKFASDDADLAVVLGHEYAHNIMGHISAKKTNALVGTALGLALDVALDTQGINSGQAFSKYGSSEGAMIFSKEYEQEADYIGLYIAALGGYDVKNAPDLWRKMALKDPESIFTGISHPTSPERSIALEKTVAEITRKQQNGGVVMPEFKE